jgi:hypothetical protein
MNECMMKLGERIFLKVMNIPKTTKNKLAYIYELQYYNTEHFYADVIALK